MKPLKPRSQKWQTYFATAVANFISGTSVSVSKLTRLADFSYEALDRYYRQEYLPKHLSPATLTIINPILSEPDRWQKILDLVEALPAGGQISTEEQYTLIGIVAIIEAWRQLQSSAARDGDASANNWPPQG